MCTLCSHPFPVPGVPRQTTTPRPLHWELATFYPLNKISAFFGSPTRPRLPSVDFCSLSRQTRYEQFHSPRSPFYISTVGRVSRQESNQVAPYGCAIIAGSHDVCGVTTPSTVFFSSRIYHHLKHTPFLPSLLAATFTSSTIQRTDTLLLNSLTDRNQHAQALPSSYSNLPTKVSSFSGSCEPQHLRSWTS